MKVFILFLLINLSLSLPLYGRVYEVHGTARKAVHLEAWHLKLIAVERALKTLSIKIGGEISSNTTLKNQIVVDSSTSFISRGYIDRVLSIDCSPSTNYMKCDLRVSVVDSFIHKRKIIGENREPLLRGECSKISYSGSKIVECYIVTNREAKKSVKGLWIANGLVNVKIVRIKGTLKWLRGSEIISVMGIGNSKKEAMNSLDDQVKLKFMSFRSKGLDQELKLRPLNINYNHDKWTQIAEMISSGFALDDYTVVGKEVYMLFRPIIGPAELLGLR
ncbi:MAG: hypothetical protein KAG61_04970 [Bacteriovoracaceae bacterium]|nr:hypothetical protein [Bacteriovoracaceae bacterium]